MAIPVKIGDTINCLPADGSLVAADITVTSSDPTIVSVSGEIVTAVARGFAIVTVVNNNTGRQINKFSAAVAMDEVELGSQFGIRPERNVKARIRAKTPPAPSQIIIDNGDIGEVLASTANFELVNSGTFIPGTTANPNAVHSAFHNNSISTTDGNVTVEVESTVATAPRYYLLEILDFSLNVYAAKSYHHDGQAVAFNITDRIGTRIPSASGFGTNYIARVTDTVTGDTASINFDYVQPGSPLPSGTTGHIGGLVIADNGGNGIVAKFDTDYAVQGAYRLIVKDAADTQLTYADLTEYGFHHELSLDLSAVATQTLHLDVVDQNHNADNNYLAQVSYDWTKNGSVKDVNLIVNPNDGRYLRVFWNSFKAFSGYRVAVFNADTNVQITYLDLNEPGKVHQLDIDMLAANNTLTGNYYVTVTDLNYGGSAAQSNTIAYTRPNWMYNIQYKDNHDGTMSVTWNSVRRDYITWRLFMKDSGGNQITYFDFNEAGYAHSHTIDISLLSATQNLQFTLQDTAVGYTVTNTSVPYIRPTYVQAFIPVVNGNKTVTATWKTLLARTCTYRIFVKNASDDTQITYFDILDTGNNHALTFDLGYLSDRYIYLVIQDTTNNQTATTQPFLFAKPAPLSQVFVSQAGSNLNYLEINFHSLDTAQKTYRAYLYDEANTTAITYQDYIGSGFDHSFKFNMGLRASAIYTIRLIDTSNNEEVDTAVVYTKPSAIGLLKVTRPDASQPFIGVSFAVNLENNTALRTYTVQLLDNSNSVLSSINFVTASEAPRYNYGMGANGAGTYKVKVIDTSNSEFSVITFSYAG